MTTTNLRQLERVKYVFNLPRYQQTKKTQRIFPQILVMHIIIIHENNSILVLPRYVGKAPTSEVETPRSNLTCKLVPAQNREYENGVLLATRLTIALLQS